VTSQTLTLTTEERFTAIRFTCWGNLREGDHLEESGVGDRIILKWILEKWNGAKNGSVCLGIRTGGGIL
jgi:hypothetical protein